MNFNNIMIGTDDAERLVDYYTRLFGEPAMSDGGYTGWRDRQRLHVQSGRTARFTARTALRAGCSGTSRART